MTILGLSPKDKSTPGLLGLIPKDRANPVSLGIKTKEHEQPHTPTSKCFPQGL